MKMARLAPGPSSESLQGRNPREIGHGCVRYGDLGVARDADVAGESATDMMLAIGIDAESEIGR